jgi:hypothetical protein
MAQAKVHISLKAELAADPQARAELLARARACGVTQVNQKRFERYGILTGLVDDAQVAALRALAVVDSVEVDKERTLR